LRKPTELSLARLLSISERLRYRMYGLVYLSGEDHSLAVAEVRGALRAMGSERAIIDDRHLWVILDGPPPPGLASRLGFCHFAGVIEAELGPAGTGELAAAAREVLLRYTGDKGVSFEAKSSTEVPRSAVFSSLESTAREMGIKVAHRDYGRKLFAISSKDMTYLGWVTSETDRKVMLNRTGSRMPYNRPIVMDPRIARAMVNLSGLPPGSRVLDPFLGPAGLAIEAAHLGIGCIGIEIEPSILQGARTNIEAQGLKGYVIPILGDSRDLERALPEGAGPFDGIVTDPPFGRSASLKGSERGALIADVIGKAACLLQQGSPIVLDSPDRTAYSRIPGCRIVLEHPHRVHRSLTRYIAVLVRT